MAAYSWLRYVQLKLIAILFRFLARFMGKFDEATEDGSVTQSQVRIPSRDQGRFINATLYVSNQSDVPALSRKPLPVLINWHGSGFVLPGLGSDALYCARIAREAGIAILDADYRKGPETTFPGPLFDAEDAIRWVASQSTRFDLTRVALSGFSAGGTLALVVASTLRAGLDGVQIQAVVAMYPATDLSFEPTPEAIPRPLRPMPPSILRFFYACYEPDRAMRTDPRVSPAFADPSLFPGTAIIIYCDGDVLMPQAQAFAKNLENGKRAVISLTCEGVPHGFDKWPKRGTVEWEQRERAYSLVIQSLKEAFHL
ncbi:alpha/beta-hydrolase [Thozetella sp. PMI_491]|nr:alpha/beta-hydrolase [Thozetella sp. PMI_491]